MVDKVKPLGYESVAGGGDDNVPIPTEFDPSEDYASVHGVALNGQDTTLVDLDGSNNIQFTDPNSGTKSVDNLYNQRAAIFVFQPGGSAQGNIFTSWANLMTALQKSSGPREIRFDNTYSMPTFPTGTYDMDGVIWSGNINSRVSTVIRIDEGVVIQNLGKIQNNLYILNYATATTPMVVANQSRLQMEHDCIIYNINGSVPFISLGTFVTFELTLINGSYIFASNSSVIDLAASSSILNLTVGAFTAVSSNTISGVSGSSVYNWLINSSGNVSTTQSSFAGTWYDRFRCEAERINFDNTSNNFTADITQDAIEEARDYLESVTSDPSSPPDARIWYRSDTDNAMLRGDGKTQSIRVTESFQGYESTGSIDLNTASPTAVPWDAQSFIDKTFSHSTSTNPSRITVNDSCLAKVSYTITLENQSATVKDVRTRIRINGLTFPTPVGHGMAQMQTTADQDTVSGSVVVSFTAGDYFEIVGDQISGAGSATTVANASHVIAELIRRT